MLAELYSRQLDAILFSVNQYAWDVVNNIASKIDMALSQPAAGIPSFDSFLENNQAVRALIFSDSLASRIDILSLSEKSRETTKQQISAELKNQISLIEKLNRFKRTGYRKIEPLIINQDSSAQKQVALFFIPDELTNQVQLVGMLLNTRSFIQNNILPKLRETAGEEFILAVFHENEPDSVFSTESISANDIKHRKALWIFPDYYLGIHLKGQTVEELARSRFYRNLVFILILDVILLGAIFFVYRNINKEIDLARMKSDFVSNVSHELKTPLALIRMFAETLEMNRVVSEEKKQEYYRVISRETERLTHLVNNILNFSRMEAGRKEYHFEKIELNELVEKVIRNYDFHLRQNGFEMNTDLHDSLPKVNADQESISEALLNLIDNAIKYSKDEKFIRVKTGTENASVFLEVEDHGIGIDDAQKEKIFEKFYRVSGGLVHNTKGSGLGLTLVKNIADAHGGRVTVDSQPGKGSCFTLYLPVG